MSQVSEIIVNWTPETSGRVSTIQIQSRIVGTSQWTEQAAAIDASLGEFRFGSNAPATDVEVRTRFRMVSGVFGPWSTDHIVTAPVTVPYRDLTGTPSKLGDINSTEGSKLGGIAPGADVTAQNTSRDTAAVAGTPAGTVRDNASTALNAVKNGAGVVTNIQVVIDSVTAERDRADTALNTAKTALNTDIASAKGAVDQVKTDAKKIADDLALEVSRAKGAEGTITTNLANVKTTADNAAAGLSDEVTLRTNADQALANRATALETTVNTGPDRNTALRSTITENATTAANATQAVANRTATIEVNYQNAAQVDARAATVANAKVADEATLRTRADDALATRSSTVESQLRGETGSAILSKINENATTAANATQAVANRTSIIEANYQSAAQVDSRATTIATAKVADEATLRANADNSLIARANTLEAQFRGETDSTVLSRIITEEGVRADAVRGVANRATSLETEVTNAKARIATVETATTDGRFSTAQRASNIESSVAGVSGRLSTVETATTDGRFATASRVNTLEASAVKGVYLSNNPFFRESGWMNSGGPPPGWTYWQTEGNPYIGWNSAASPSNYGAPHAVQIDRQGENCGLYHTTFGQFPRGWYVMEADVRLEDGNVFGSGMHVNFQTGSADQMDFARYPDSAGETGDLRRNRSFSKLVFNNTETDRMHVYMMAGWGGFNGYTGFLRTIWHKAGVRAATKQEIDSGKVDNLIARVTTTEGVANDARGRVGAYWQVTADAGNGRGQLTVRADGYGGGVDIVGDVAIKGQNGNGRTVVSNAGVMVYDPNGTLRVRLGIF